MITRLNKIDHRIFQGFSWPPELPDFSRFNLIYGWNGSGKTTLSNLLRYLERKQSISEGKIEFHFDGNSRDGATLATASGVPTVRVFNQNYRDDSIFSTVQQMKPIFFLGKDSVEKQKKIEELTATRTTEQKRIDESNVAKRKAVKALDELCIREAKTIKELLSSSGSNSYNNYDKGSFKYAAERLSKDETTFQRLTAEERERLRRQKDETPKEPITKIGLTTLDFEALRGRVDELLQRTVASKVIEELSVDPSLADWVLAGIKHHTGKKHSDKCRFCESPLPAGRIERLRAHFNDEYNQLLTGLETIRTEIEKTKAEFADMQLPARSAFYDHLGRNFSDTSSKVVEFIRESRSYLTKLSEAVDKKRSKPFESLALTSILEAIPPAEGPAIIEAVNEVINRHNVETNDFEKVIGEARNSLEQDFVLEALPDFKDKSQKTRDIEEEINKGISTMRGLSEQIRALERDIIEHQRPADELSSELRSYLGRDELIFSVFGNGYQITRNGIPASNLSEGERTAIALLYFLKSLQDKEFSLCKDIVVIDDPVSSLDANSLFCAFGYIKERTKEAGQLFILTHNFPLFRQVKNWFNHLPHQGKKDIAQRPARFYMVEASMTSGGKRNALLKPLDRLLHEFESEYHYLFKRVHDEASNLTPDRGLEEFYSMPNIARRVLESFLSFRYPGLAGKLEQQLECVSFDPAKKGRIIRFLHTYSHEGKIAEPEHDLSILAETPDVLKDVLALVRAEDEKHYDEMAKLIQPPAL
jgi:wobble nucleotide-excising tRNase